MNEKKKTSKLVIVLLVILAIVVMYILPFGLSLWFFASEEVKIEEKNNQILIDNGDMVVNNITSYYDEEDEIYYIMGTLKNNEESHCDYLYIEFNVYDVDGNVLGEAVASINGLDEGASWKFKAKYEENDAFEVTNYKFSTIELY